MSQKPFSDHEAATAGLRTHGSAPPGELDLDFRQLWQVLVRRRKIVAASAVVCVVATAIAVFSMTPIYEAKALLLIEKVGQNTLEREGVAVDAVQDDYYQTQYTILQSRSLAERVAGDLKLADVPEFAGADPVGALQARVSIAPVRRTRLVYIAAESKDPALAARIANQLALGYIQQSSENRMFVSRDLLKTIDAKASPASLESLPAVVNSPLIQQLKGQAAMMEGDLAEKEKRYTPQHPEMVQLRAHLASVRAQIEREVRHIVESVRLQLSGEFVGGNVRVVDPARPPDRPARPRKGRALELALLLGLAAGFGLALLVDRLDLTVRSAEDAEQLVKLPCLAMLQHLEDAEMARGNRFEPIWAGTRSQAGEAFRNLRTAISFRLASVKGSTVILVTSAVQEEGKSFIAANIARAFAQAGERVLLIDGDLRRPSVHRIFGITGEHGLSSYLASGNGTKPAVQEAGVSNLTLLSSGPIPDNPAELLGDTRLGDLIGWAQEQYTRVIVDSPPVFPVTDALLWTRHAHGVVMVVRAGATRAALVGRALHRLKDGFANVIGVVLNQSSPESLEYYRYYHGYYAAEKMEATGKK